MQTKEEITKLNEALFKELWDRGLHVQKIGQLHAGELDYLVVSCAEPKNVIITERDKSN